MRLTSADWRHLRGAVGVFALCALLASGMVAATAGFHAAMAREQALSEARLNAATRAFQAVSEQAAAMTEFEPRLRELNERGIVDDEHRLSWVEALRGAGDALGLPGLSWEIDARVPIASGPAAGRLRVSRMKVTLGLREEADLGRFLGYLEQRAQGLFSVQDCLLTRVEARGALPPGAARLRARCGLDWYTLALPTAGAGHPVSGGR